jgi:hypothetical protein
MCLNSGILLKKKKNMIEEIKLECAEKFNEEVLYFFLLLFNSVALLLYLIHVTDSFILGIKIISRKTDLQSVL